MRERRDRKGGRDQRRERDKGGKDDRDSHRESRSRERWVDRVRHKDTRERAKGEGAVSSARGCDAPEAPGPLPHQGPLQPLQPEACLSLAPQVDVEHREIEYQYPVAYTQRILLSWRS